MSEKYSCVVCKAKNLSEDEVVWPHENISSKESISENFTVCLKCLLTSPIIKRIADKRKLKTFLKEWDKKHETKLYNQVFGDKYE
ncbi:MAG: hypothetical protein QXM86_04895 [Candidatus Bathyarchaeia archaeon]